MRLKEFEGVAGKRDQFQIDPRLLMVRPNFNIRDLSTPVAREKLDTLKAQVRAEGVLEALEIEFDGTTPWINEGHRRHLVVMELIAEGMEFKTIPCIQERLGTDEKKRALHMLMRKKEDYEPLEYAKGIERMVNVYGWDKGDLATSLGFKAKASIDQYLAMLAMPEPIKQHVRNGEISATLARNIAKGTDPDKAEELIRANLEENKRIKGSGGKRNVNVKVTAKTLKRDHPKPRPAQQEPAKPEPQTTLAADNAREDQLTIQAGDELTNQMLAGEAPPIAAQAPPEHLPKAPQLEMTEPKFRSDKLTHEIASDLGMPPEANAPARFHEDWVRRQNVDTGPKPRELFDALETLAKEARKQIEAISIESPMWNFSGLQAAVEEAERLVERVNMPGQEAA